MRIDRVIYAAMALLVASGLSIGPAAAGETAATPNAGEAKISQAQAEKIALGQVPGGTVKEAELEKEHGKLHWSLEIASADSKTVTEVEVDAMTGEIMKEHDDD